MEVVASMVDPPVPIIQMLYPEGQFHMIRSDAPCPRILEHFGQFYDCIRHLPLPNHPINTKFCGAKDSSKPRREYFTYFFLGQKHFRLLHRFELDLFNAVKTLRGLLSAQRPEPPGLRESSN